MLSKILTHTKSVLCSCLLPTLGPPGIFSATASATRRPHAICPGPYLASPGDTACVRDLSLPSSPT